MKMVFIDAIATNDINDQNQLYYMEKNASDLLEIDSPVYIKKARANNKTKDNEFRKEKFTYKAEADVFTCPAGKAKPYFENTSKDGLKYRRYKSRDCSGCKYKNACTSSASGRTMVWEVGR